MKKTTFKIWKYDNKLYELNIRIVFKTYLLNWYYYTCYYIECKVMRQLIDFKSFCKV